MADGAYLSNDDVAILRRMADAFRRGENIEQKGEGLPPVRERVPICWGVPRGTVYGTCIGTDPNPETLDLYKFTSTGGTTATGTNVRVYNLGPTDCTTDGYLIAHRDQRTDRWVTAGTGGTAATSSKKLCRFLLDAALTTSDASGTAVITSQYGDGTAHSTVGTITVGNMLTQATSAYLFSGSSGAAGLAYWDSGTNWRIIQMECP